MRKRTWDRVKGALLLFLGAVVFCLAIVWWRHSPKKEIFIQQTNIAQFSRLYQNYVRSHRGQPPKSEHDLKTYAQSLSPESLQSLGIFDVEGCFLSSRDHQPYLFVPPAAQGKNGPGLQPVVAYEQRGVQGKRYVVSAVGAAEEIDEAKFKEWVPVAK